MVENGKSKKTELFAQAVNLSSLIDYQTGSVVFWSASSTSVCQCWSLRQQAARLVAVALVMKRLRAIGDVLRSNRSCGEGHTPSYLMGLNANRFCQHGDHDERIKTGLGIGRFRGTQYFEQPFCVCL